MTTEIIDTVINTFGNPHFRGDEIAEALYPILQEWQAAGRNTGSIIALLNALPTLEQNAKELY